VSALIDLLAGRGDWFGTVHSGYFLIPALLRGLQAPFGDLWENAAIT
jgi:hypothetical protein